MSGTLGVRGALSPATPSACAAGSMGGRRSRTGSSSRAMTYSHDTYDQLDLVVGEEVAGDHLVDGDGVGDSHLGTANRSQSGKSESLLYLHRSIHNC